ncbi:MAG TPA: hypothetical protein VHK91_11265, partial [Flavisolibacter sp.]|nr:hypothetical protein [Flavisolibacter sp.]
MIKNYTLLFYRCFLLLLTGIGITARGAAQNLKWLQTAGSSAVQGGTVNTTSVAAGNDGTFFITGDFRNTVDLDPGPGMVNETATYASQNLFLANMDASGKLLFEKTIKGSGKAVINKIVTDRQHHLWLTGSVEGTFDFDPGPGVHNYTSSGQDAFLAQFDDKGNLLWFGGLGEAGKDAGTALWADDQNNIYLGGYFSDHIDLDPGPSTSSFMTAGPRSLFLAKFNENAGFQFGWILESSGSNALSAIETDANGHIHLLGNFQSVMDFDPGSGITSRATAGASDIFLAEYDAAGTFQSVSTFGGIGTDLGTSMRISSSTIYLTGSFEYTVDFDGGPLSVKRTSLGYSDLYLAACDLSGNLLWVHTAGGSVIDRGTSLTIDPDNNIYLTGSYTGTVDFDPSPGTYNLTASNNSLHAYLSKYDAGGHFIYARSINGSGTETTAGIAADLANHLFLCGSFTKTADFDPGPASQPLTAGSGATGTNGFFGAYSFDGEWISSGLQGGYDVVGLNCEVLDVVTDAQGNSYQVGVFNGTVDFDPGPETVSLKSNGSYDVFLSKYDASGKLVFVKSFGSSSDDRGYAIGLDKNGHIIIAGYFYGQADFDPGPGIQLLQSNNGTIAGFFSQFDTDGNFIYARVLLNSDVLDLAIDPGNNIILSGEFLAGNDFDPGPDILQLSHEARGYNSYISKYDNTGKLLFARALGGTQQDGAGTALAVDKAGSIYVSGYFFGSGDFDPGTGVSLLASLSDQATVFLGKFDASGNYIYAKSIGNTGQVWPGGLALNDGDEPYLLTYFTDKATFGTGSGAVTLTDERATGDIALARYDADGNFLKVTHISGDNLQAYRILVDPAGSVTMMGWSHGVIDRDPGAGESLFTSTGSSTFILRLSADDAPEKFISMGDHGAQVFGYALAAADGNRILVAGWYYYDQEADAGHQSIFQQSTSSVQGFLAKWSTRELQDIAWPELFVRNYVAAPMDVPVSASSGLPIHYSSSNERVANVSNGKITITGVGETTITASQEGNEV